MTLFNLMQLVDIEENCRVTLVFKFESFRRERERERERERFWSLDNGLNE